MPADRVEAIDFTGQGVPLVRGLLDTDLYKLLMPQVIWRRHRSVPVTFSLVNRTRPAIRPRSPAIAGFSARRRPLFASPRSRSRGPRGLSWPAAACEKDDPPWT